MYLFKELEILKLTDLVTLHNGKELKASDKKKGIATRTVCKRVKDPMSGWSEAV